MATPYSRMFLNLVPWYSILIVTGAALAIWLAVREEKRSGLPKDTVIDFSLLALPCGIIGARIYFVLFSWSRFRSDFLSVFRIWEGGIAIYGAVIGGLLAAVFFSRRRRISVLTLCDLIAPGLILAQAIGRWGNYFNQEAYGLQVTSPSLCFFPFAVLIESGSDSGWHMATFFYESCWNFLVFFFLLRARRKWFRYPGDVFFFYAYLYACGRLIIEDFRMDSLYAASDLRISQLLSLLICSALLIRYLFLFRLSHVSGFPRFFVFLSFLLNIAFVPFMTGIFSWPQQPLRFFLLLLCSMMNLFALMSLYRCASEGDILYADVRK